MSVLAEANRIKERLRACTTVEEVEQVAADEREKVSSWKDKGGNQGAMFFHIINLKKYMLGKLKK